MAVVCRYCGFCISESGCRELGVFCIGGGLVAGGAWDDSIGGGVRLVWDVGVGVGGTDVV